MLAVYIHMKMTAENIMCFHKDSHATWKTWNFAGLEFNQTLAKPGMSDK